jgi:hypothetical protein
MTDRIDFGSEPWQAIPRRVLRDKRLTARAKGGLVTLLSHEEGWVRSSIAMLQRECRCGAKQAQSIMAELRDLGYAELITDHVEGRIRRRYVISAVPKGDGSQATLVAALSSTNPDGHVPDRSGQGGVVVDPQDVEPLDVEPPKTDSKAAPRFVSEDEMYLASRIGDAHGRTLQPAAIQKLNTRFGTASVTSALRVLHGNPPKDPIHDVYAYVESLCAMEVTA